MHARLCQKEVNVEADTTIVMWHKRLCHMSQKGMQMLLEGELLPEMKKMHLDKCVDCLVGKQKTVAFHPRPSMKKKKVVELMHTDVCYIDVKSHVGAQYFVTFIHDYSRKLWASLLKTKDQVLVFLKEF